ncbi:MAG: ATP-binding protein [Deltaproteobacteria bacterium]|nr:ATP-binding protein [Deltaproteobacteria bacterium]MDZ4224269.1 ATP-binding protein [bacterium]
MNSPKDILDHMGTGLLTVNPEGKIAFANVCASRLLGWKTNELVGKPLSVVVKDQFFDAANPFRREDLLFFRKNNESFPVECIHAGGGVITFQDISERKRVEDQKDEFISNLSHELRSPLTIIKGAIWNLKDGIMGKLTEKQAKLVETTSRHIDKLSRLVEEVLEISRLQSGKVQITRRRVNIAHVIEATIGDYHMAAKEKYIGLKADVAPELPPVYADSDMVEQVLHNLLNNALRFAKSSIVITARPADNGFVRIGVVDDGLGVAKEDQPRLFSKFEQLQRPQGVPGYKGTGLGLAISKEIVSHHQGNIWVESDLGKGAAFYFTLPEYDPAADFRFMLHGAMKEADRRRVPLALAVLSIDNLRSAKGNGVLHKIGEALKEKMLRKKDMLFRYTLKDFALILPDTPLDGANIISGRVEQFIRAGLQESPQSGKEPVIRSGIVLYPNDATSAERLIEIAFERTNGKIQNFGGR